MKGYFKAHAGADSSSLGVRDTEVKALRNLGFTGNLSDMRRAFYQEMTGDSFLADAKVKLKRQLIRKPISFKGKSRGNGDSSKLIHYGFSNSVLNSPASYPNEVGGGYSNVFTKDGNPMMYMTSNNRFVGFMFTFNISEHLTKAKLRIMNELKFAITTGQVSVSIWSVKENRKIELRRIEEVEYVDQEFDLLGFVNDCVDGSGNIRIMVDSTIEEGAKTVNIDFAELVPTYMK